MSYPPFLSFKKLVKKNRLDLIHAHSPFLQCWYAMLMRHIFKIPMIATFHTHLAEYVGHLFPPAEELIKNMLYEPMWTFTRKQYNLHDAVITPSKVMRKELEDHGIKNVVDVPNPISPLFFEKDLAKNKQRAIAFRHRFNIPMDAKVLLYVGRIAFEKRLEVLLKAYKNINLKYENTYLAIVGDCPQLNMYKEKAKKLGLRRCIFTGYVHHRQLPGVYRAGDIFISPSNTETQGLTFIEAMSQGIPVIGVNSRGVSDYVKHNINGFLANNLDYTEFERIIEHALVNFSNMKLINANALETAQKFSYPGFKKRLLEAYTFGIENWKKKGAK